MQLSVFEYLLVVPALPSRPAVNLSRRKRKKKRGKGRKKEERRE
jgi:hypothetical protein